MYMISEDSQLSWPWARLIEGTVFLEISTSVNPHLTGNELLLTIPQFKTAFNPAHRKWAIDLASCIINLVQQRSCEEGQAGKAAPPAPATQQEVEMIEIE